jgi:anti-anti-sigma regulatory factor
MADRGQVEPVESPQPTAHVRVRRGLGDSRRPITLAEVEGAHDVHSSAKLISALDELDGHLIVDLTRCAVLDAAAMRAILGKALELGRRGCRLELIVPASGPLARTIDLAGFDQLVRARNEPRRGGVQGT